MQANKKLRVERSTLDNLVRENYSDFNYGNALKQFIIMDVNNKLSYEFENENKMPTAVLFDYAISVIFPELINLVNQDKTPKLSTSYAKLEIRFGEVGVYPYYKFQY